MNEYRHLSQNADVLSQGRHTRANGLLWAGIGFAGLAVATYALNFLVTVVVMTQSFNAMSGLSDVAPEEITRRMEFCLDFTTRTFAVAIPSAILAVGLILAGLVVGSRNRRRFQLELPPVKRTAAAGQQEP
jgi:hypothetical protein